MLLALTVTSVQGQNFLQQANTISDLLTQEQKAEALRALDDEERFNWYFVPILREGVTLAELNDEQEQAVVQLIQSAISPTAYTKATDIMSLEHVLKAIEPNGGGTMSDGTARRDAEKYYWIQFGEAANEKPWAWRFEGHHLSLSFTMMGSELVAATPFFFGSNPGKVDVPGFEKMEVLKLETSMGFQLVNSLNKEQLALARFSETAPNDIYTSNDKEARRLEPLGLGYADLTGKQKKIFHELLEVYISNYQFGFADQLREKIEATGYDQLYFAWAGSMKPGAGHYYRIQGGTLLIEYDNTQNGANHVHAVIRDLSNDFGENILKEHYAKSHNE